MKQPLLPGIEPEMLEHRTADLIDFDMARRIKRPWFRTQEGQLRCFGNPGLRITWNWQSLHCGHLIDSGDCPSFLLCFEACKKRIKDPKWRAEAIEAIKGYLIFPGDPEGEANKEAASILDKHYSR